MGGNKGPLKWFHEKLCDHYTVGLRVHHVREREDWCFYNVQSSAIQPSGCKWIFNKTITIKRLTIRRQEWSTRKPTVYLHHRASRYLQAASLRSCWLVDWYISWSIDWYFDRRFVGSIGGYFDWPSVFDWLFTCRLIRHSWESKYILVDTQPCVPSTINPIPINLVTEDNV